MKRLNWASTRNLGTYPELFNIQTVIKACIVIMHVALLLANNKIRLRAACCTTAQSDQHFVIRYLKGKWLGQISLNSYILGRLQHDKVPVATPLIIVWVQWQISFFIYIQIVGQNFCVHKYWWCVQRYQWRISKRHSMYKIQSNVVH